MATPGICHHTELAPNKPPLPVSVFFLGLGPFPSSLPHQPHNWLYSVGHPCGSVSLRCMRTSWCQSYFRPWLLPSSPLEVDWVELQSVILSPSFASNLVCNLGQITKPL